MVVIDRRVSEGRVLSSPLSPLVLSLSLSLVEYHRLSCLRHDVHECSFMEDNDYLHVR